MEHKILVKWLAGSMSAGKRLGLLAQHIQRSHGEQVTIEGDIKPNERKPTMSSASLEFGGQERFDASPEKVFAVVTNLDLLAANIPDAVSTQKIDERTLNCTVQPHFAFLRGTLKLVIQLTDIDPPSSAALAIDGRGIGQQIKLVSTLRLSPDGDGSLMEWNARVVELKGLIATVGKSLIQAAAGQVIRDAWQKIHAQVEG